MGATLTLPSVERRVTMGGELRVGKRDDGSPLIGGYAAVFNKPSDIIGDWLGSFREIVAPGAFTKTIKDGADVRALMNHDPNFVLGRTKSGTLQVWEDDHGLAFEATPPETQWARDLMETMKRGDISQSSFGFRTIRDRWGNGKDDDGDEIDERTLLEVQLFDVSPVTFPAYPQTESTVRDLLRGTGVDYHEFTRVFARLARGLPLNESDQRVLDASMRAMEALRPVPSQPAHTERDATAVPSRTAHLAATLAAQAQTEIAQHDFRWGVKGGH
jgi:hypothetical protein